MFTPRTFVQILDDMIAYVLAYTQLTDMEIGSAVRTILEAAALEDDEQYFQMVQLLDAFSWQTAQGSDLDARVADYNVTRLQPAPSAGQVVFQDLLLIQNPLAFDSATGALSLQVDNSTAFPTAGYPYNIRVGEGTIAVEDVIVTNNDVLTGTFTLSVATLNNHSIGARVAFVSGASDRAIAASVQVQVPAIGQAAPIKFVTIEPSTLVNGNFESTPTNARAVLPGALGNVGANLVVQFTSSPPFSGAGVRNPRPFAGGRNTETDTQLRDRARQQIQSLSRGTVLALKQAALGVTDPVTGQRVVTANLIEDFVNEEVIVYIDDGTGFTPSTVILPRSTILNTPVPNPGAGLLSLVSTANFPQQGYVLASTEDPTQTELLHFSSADYIANTITLSSPTTRTHDISDEVVMVDLMEPDAEPGTTFLQTQNFPLVRSSIRLWVNTGGGFLLQVEGTDYFINRGTGEVQLVASLPSGAQVAAAYTYYTGLVATVQQVIDGSITDPVDFPGVRAAGIIVVVETPIIHRISASISLSAIAGFTEADLVAPVREAVENYISSLAIGQDVILAKMVEVIMEVAGVYDVVITSPVSNVVILQNELPVPFDSAGNSLITVT